MLGRILVAGAAVAALAACATDYDDNPPGLAGGWGTNWENPPGPQGGPGASPNRYYRWEGERYAFEPRGPGGFQRGSRQQRRSWSYQP